MGSFFESIRKQLNEWNEKTSRSTKIRIAVLSVIALIAIIVAVSLLTKTQYVVLYSRMDSQNAAAVQTRLEELGVAYKTEGADTILVPREQHDDLLIRLNGEDLAQNSLPYDMYANAAGFGSTDSEKRLYQQWTLQEQLASIIKTFNDISDAKVLVNLAQQSSFVLSNSESSNATATVNVTTKGGGRLSSEQVRSIVDLVLKGVPGLASENLSIVDSTMHSYGVNGGEDGLDGDRQQLQSALQNQMQGQIQAQVLNLLAPVFGTDKVRAMVNISLDWDKKVTEKIEYAPPVEGSDKGLEVSYKELYERVANGTTAAGEPGIDPNSMIPGYPTVDATGDSQYLKNTREANLEINETKTRIESAQGEIKDLSIAVILDSEANAQDYSQSVKNLLTNGLGVDAKRISIESLPFQPEDTSAAAALAELADKRAQADALNQLINTIVLGLAGVIVALMIFLIVRALKPKPVVALPEGGEFEGAGDMPEGMGEGFDIVVGDTEQGSEQPKEPTTLMKIEQFIDKDAEAVARLLRNWLSDK